MLAEHYCRDILSGKRQGADARILISLMGIPAISYEAILRLRILAYSLGLLYTKRLPKPVISVGNITAGGTGKTPIVELIARYCLDRGKRVAVLSRGYRGSAQGRPGIVSDGLNLLMSPDEAGDEPYMLAEKNPGLMVITGADRYAAGILAMERLKPDIFIMDDGFQHLRLYRDLNILLMDHERPLGNGRVLPAGLMREPRSEIKRADLIIYTRCESKDVFDHFPGIPYCTAFHDIADMVRAPGGETVPISSLSRKRGTAFAGIAEPDSFFAMLDKAGLDILEKIRFQDHCNYGEKEISKIISVSKSASADYLITTEKDSVKLSAYRQRLGKIYSSVLEVKIHDMNPLAVRLEKIICCGESK
ncbi:MAG TPA: tetraacyldisaccharide 4'-kinase [Geobacteraceae bacterium]|nr:tetraacyldisaccharide 4'-kinase [Geobacteraceae bacterium]